MQKLWTGVVALALTSGIGILGTANTVLGACTSCGSCPTGVGYCDAEPQRIVGDFFCFDLGCNSFSFTNGDVCGETVTICPTTEAGQCADGVNNDAWLDSLTDCQDPDCSDDLSCYGAAPALGSMGMSLLALALAGLGLTTLRRRQEKRVG